MKITKALLESHHACPERVEVFEAQWPDGVEISKESLSKAIALGVPIEWLACWLKEGVDWKSGNVKVRVDQEMHP